MRQIRLMAEYERFPLWEQSPGHAGDINPADLPISKSLQDQLLAWAATFEKTYNRSDPLRSGFNTLAEGETFNRRGVELAQELQRQLGCTNFRISCWDDNLSMESYVGP